MRGARAVQHIRYDQACAGSWRVRVSGQQPTPAMTTLSIQISGPGVLTDGFDSTSKSLRTLSPGAHWGNCLLHAVNTHSDTVGRRITPPTAAPNRSVPVSVHSAPQYSGAGHAYLAVGNQWC